MTGWESAATAAVSVAALILAVAATAIAARTAERLTTTLRGKADGEGGTKPEKPLIQIELTDEPPRRRRPLKLTEHGQALMEYMDGLSWAAAESDRLKLDIRKMEPYEVDLFAQKVLENHGLFKAKTSCMLAASQTLHDQVSRTAYEHGVTREDVLTALRVLLREELLKTHVDEPANTETKGSDGSARSERDSAGPKT